MRALFNSGLHPSMVPDEFPFAEDDRLIEFKTAMTGSSDATRRI